MTFIVKLNVFNLYNYLKESLGEIDTLAESQMSPCCVYTCPT